MGILIGMDEAGYGPNLGPLVVAATAWEVADSVECHGSVDQDGEFTSASGHATTVAVDEPSVVVAHPQSAVRNPKSKTAAADLYQLLRGTVCRKPSERQIAIADSKALYKPGLGLRQLERGLHAVLLSMRESLGSWSEMVGGCRADPDGHHQRLSWHDGFDCALPVDAAADELELLAARLTRTCETAGVRPLAIRARLVFPAEFNELIDYYGNKAAALSHVTIGLLRDVVELARETACPVTYASSSRSSPAPSPQPPVFALCDKHGGRNFYTALLQHHFSEHWIQPVYESHAESRYEWGAASERVQVTFRMNGEEFLPTALASMAAKYLRELAMRAFNEFWCARIPNLRPTAGYYGDSSRFKREITPTQRQLGIDDHVLWRNR